jgi:hypothetical protein
MNHKFEKNDTDSFNWDLAIMLNNEIKLIYAIYYDLEFEYYYVYIPKKSTKKSAFDNDSYVFSYKRNYSSEIIQYLISNNICIIDKSYNYDTYNILILTQGSLLGLI